MQVVVVGSGRSGTSMVIRMLNICGVELGVNQYVASVLERSGGDERAADLPIRAFRDFWEHPWLNDFNDRLVSRLAGSSAATVESMAPGKTPVISPWSFAASAPLLAEGWELDAALDDLYGEGRELLDRVFGDHADWGWKMPRAAFTIPFWRRLMPDARYVICVRNPIDFAQSLDRYEGFSRAYSYAMWLRYNMAVLADTKPSERFLTSYEDYFPDFRNAFFPLLDFLGLARPEAGSEAEQAIIAFHSPGLKHHNSPVRDTLSDPQIPDAVKRLYSEILDGPPSGANLPILDQHRLIAPFLKLTIDSQSVNEERARISGRIEELSQRYDSLEARYWENEEHRHAQLLAIDRLTGDLKRCNDLLAERQTRIESLTADTASLVANVRRCNEVLADRDSEIDVLKSNADKLLSDIHDCNMVIAERDSRIVQLEADAQQLIADIGHCNQVLAERDERVNRLSSDVDKLVSDVQRCNDVIGERDERINQLDSDVERLLSDVQRCNEVIGERDERIATLVEDLERSEAGRRRLEQLMATRAHRFAAKLSSLIHH